MQNPLGTQTSTVQNVGFDIPAITICQQLDNDGFGGLKHCLIPEPKHILIKRDEDGKIETSLFSEEQTAADYLNILGYNAQK